MQAAHQLLCSLDPYAHVFIVLVGAASDCIPLALLVRLVLVVNRTPANVFVSLCDVLENVWHLHLLTAVVDVVFLVADDVAAVVGGDGLHRLLACILFEFLFLELAILSSNVSTVVHEIIVVEVVFFLLLFIDFFFVDFFVILFLFIGGGVERVGCG